MRRTDVPPVCGAAQTKRASRVPSGRGRPPPQRVYFEGNCIGPRSEIAALLRLPWKISGGAIRGIDRRG